MTPDQVRKMVAAMHEAGEDDDAIQSALSLAQKSDPREKVKQEKAAANEAKLKELGGPQVLYSSPDERADLSQERAERWNSPVARIGNAIGPAFTNNFAFGILGHGLDLLPDKVAHHLGGTRQERQAAREGSPVGDVIGSALGFGAGMAAGPEKLVSQGVEAALPAAKTVAGRIVRGGASGGLQAGVAGGANKALEGGDIKETGKAAAAAAPVGVGLGAAFTGMNELAGGAKELAGKVFNAFRDPKSALGGAADTLGTLDKMRGRGAIEGDLKRTVNDPELADLPRGKKGYIKASQQARDKISAATADELKTARTEYGKQIDEITGEHASEPYSMEGPQARIDALRAENTVNGEAVDELLGAALDKAQRMITVKSPESAGNPLVAEASARESTVADMIKVKKAMDKKAEWGMPATPENRPYRMLAREFADQAKGIDKRLAPLNEKYQQVMSKLEEANDIMYGKDAPEVADRSAARRRAAGVIHRVGDDTAAGGMAQEELERLMSLDPRYAKALRTVEEKKALESTRFGFPQMSKSPEKWGTGLVEQNLDAIRARVIDPAARSLRHGQSASTRKILPGFIPAIEQAVQDWLDKQEQR